MSYINTISCENISKAIVLLKTYNKEASLSSSVDQAAISAIQDAILNVGSIFIQYRNWNDPFSLKVHGLGVRVFTDLENFLNNHDSTKSISEFAQKKFTELLDLLRNSLDKAPLEDPMLDGEWMWEKKTLMHYQTLSSLSPFTGKSFAAISHEFAKDIIAWKKKLVVKGNNSDHAQSIKIPIANPFFFINNSLTIPEETEETQLALLKKIQLAYFQQIASFRKNEKLSLELTERAKILKEQTEKLVPTIHQ